MKRSRHDQEKKSFNKDSEAERENAHLVSTNMAWLFVDTELMLLSLSSTKWPSKLKASQKLSMIEGECYNLKIKDNEYPCRLLTKVPAKKVEQEMAHYKAEIEEGKRPSYLRKRVLTSSKAPMVEVDFLSSSRPPIMTSAELSLGKNSGQTSKTSKSTTSQQPAIVQSNICDQVIFSMKKKTNVLGHKILKILHGVLANYPSSIRE